MGGASEEHSSLHLRATVQMEVQSRCELVLRVSARHRPPGALLTQRISDAILVLGAQLFLAYDSYISQCYNFSPVSIYIHVGKFYFDFLVS